MKRDFVCVVGPFEPSKDCFFHSKRQITISGDNTQFTFANDEKETDSKLAIFETLLGDYQELCRMDVSSGILNIQLARLNDECQYHCLVGQQGVEVLRLSELKGITLGGREFAILYDFAYFVCREKGKKHLQVQRACELWNFLLQDRFRMLQKWITFVKESKLQIITKDVWREVLDFSGTVYEDLSNYDMNGAWPVILDEFVIHLKQKQCQESTLSDRLLSLSLTPQPGNKRRITLYLDMEGEECEIHHGSKQSKSSTGCLP